MPQPDRVVSLFKYEGNKYDVDEVYIDSTDKNGHRERTQVSLPQGTLAQINYIVMMMHDEYRGNAHAFIRDAIVHRMHWANEKLKDPGLERQLGVERSRSRAARAQAELTDKLDNTKEIIGMMQSASSARDARMLERMIEVAEEMAEEIGEPYATQILDEVKKYR